MAKNPKFLLYELGEKSRRLEETILSEKGIKEKYIQDFFRENLFKVFGLTFLKEEHYLTNPDTGERDCRADTLAFSKKGYFVVIEYKRDKSLELYEQAAGYISCLNDTENSVCVRNGHKLIDILREKEKTRKWDYDNVFWKETKGICIAAEIDKRLLYHQRQKDEDIKILEIKFYDDKKILYIDTNNLPEWLTVNFSKNTASTSKSDKIQTNEPEILEKINKWFVEVENYIYSLKSLERRDWKKEGYYPRLRYYEKTTGKKLVSLVVKSRKINIYWSAENPQNVSQNLKVLLENHGFYYHLRDHGVGKNNWFFSIENENDFQKLKEFIQEYKEKFGQDKIKT